MTIECHRNTFPMNSMVIFHSYVTFYQREIQTWECCVCVYSDLSSHLQYLCSLQGLHEATSTLLCQTWRATMNLHGSFRLFPAKVDGIRGIVYKSQPILMTSPLLLGENPWNHSESPLLLGFFLYSPDMNPGLALDSLHSSGQITIIHQPEIRPIWDI